MKKIVLAIALLLSLGQVNAVAEGNSTNTSSVRYVKAPRFARPLIEKWISEYAKVEPSIQFEIAKGNTQSADLNIAFDNQAASSENIQHTIYFGELAVLPITARDSEADKALEGKKLNVKKLKQLYFLNDDFEEDVKKNKVFEQLIIYSGSNATSVANSFAHNFGEESSSFRGKRISGDDLFLNTAIQKDPLGVTFNTLPNIFDLKSRHLKNDLSLISIDVKKDLEAVFSNKGTLDEVIGILENGKVQEVAVEKVGFSYNGVDDAVTRFLDWILDNGTRYNHDFGLLNLDRKMTDTQKQKVYNNSTAQQLQKNK